MSLQSGMEVQVTRLKTRQFFRLLKVLTHGAGQALIQTSLNFNADPGEFSSKLLMLVMFSIPDAEQEAIDFVQSMVRPKGLQDAPFATLTDAQKEENQALWKKLGDELFNPELDDLVNICELVVKQESGDIQALGKRLAGLLKLAQKTGADKPGQPEETPSPEAMSQASQDSTQPSST
jgi:hypothetical protein